MKLLSFALLSSLALAAPFKTLSKGRPSQSLTWYVTDFTVPQSSGSEAPHYNFHIAGIATKNTPGFNTTCTGVTGSREEYVPCRDEQVRAIVAPKGASRWDVEVQHGWTKGEAEFWAVGSTNTTAPAKRFTIKVDEQYGVA